MRIVTFPGADTCACCGTHVSSAGQIGLVKLLSVQKFREGVRIELVCGGRALAYLSRVMEQNHQISNLLSAKPLETAAAARRLLEENAALKSRLIETEQARFAALASAAGKPVICASGMGGIGGFAMKRRNMGRMTVVGDFRSDVASLPPFAPRVMQCAAMQADAALEWLLTGTMKELL